MASIYGGQLTGIELYGYMSMIGSDLYVYPGLVSVYGDSCVLYLCVICVSKF